MEVDGFYMNIDGMKDMNLSPTNWDPNSKKFSPPKNHLTIFMAHQPTLPNVPPPEK